MKDMEQMKSWYSKELEERKHWYSPVADAYNKARPRYPKNIIHRVVELAELNSKAKILEVGCGPGNATEAFAQLGFSMVCLEPSQEFYQLAQQNFKQYSSVEIRNISFEEWQLETERFDAVLAANSWHWMLPEIRYLKAAEALKSYSFLVLLWNMTPEPKYEIYQVLQEVYQRYAPSLARYEGRETQSDILQGFGQNVTDSGLFNDLVSEQVGCELTYSTDDYLTLLSTISSYRTLDPQSKDSLFEGLRDKIEKNLGGSIEISYLCAFHIARKYR